jgi:hypothetical protein
MGFKRDKILGPTRCATSFELGKKRANKEIFIDIASLPTKTHPGGIS